jgi:hypothetical protein
MEAVVYDGPRTVSVKEVPDARVDNLIPAWVQTTLGDGVARHPEPSCHVRNP